MRERRERREEKGGEMRWGWLRFFSGRRQYFLFSRPGRRKTGQANSFSCCQQLNKNATTRKQQERDETRQTRHEVRYEKKRGGADHDKHHQKKGKGKGKDKREIVLNRRGAWLTLEQPNEMGLKIGIRQHQGIN